jgi:NCAIR mutase (PurE)-related protein
VRVGQFGDLDTRRLDRTGTPEVILAEDKRDEHLAQLCEAFVDDADWALVSRLASDRVPLVEGEAWQTTYHEDARLAVLRTERAELPDHGGRVAVIAAGTADVGVAEEARLAARHTGASTQRAYDVGVAGPHRLGRALDDLDEEPDVFVCAAGREAALPTVLAGTVEQSVVAVPTSVGYGHRGSGKSALSSVLQSCAPLLAVNIDAGLPAGLCASKIARQAGRARRDRDTA